MPFLYIQISGRVCLSLPPVCPSVPSASLSVYMSAPLSVCMSVCLSVCLFFSRFVHQSVCAIVRTSASWSSLDEVQAALLKNSTIELEVEANGRNERYRDRQEDSWTDQRRSDKIILLPIS